MKRFVVNGKTLMGGHTGIYRYTFNVLKALDRQLKEYSDLDMVILFPEEARSQGLEIIEEVDFKKIKIEYYKKCPHNSLTLWQSFCFLRYIRKNKAIPISFANIMPYTIRNGIVVIHDIMPLMHPEWSNKKKVFKTSIMQNRTLSAKKITYIADSNHTVNQIKQYKNGKYSTKEFCVIGCAWNHIENVKSDDSVFADGQIGITEKDKGKYVFSMSGNGMNRNFKWIYEFAEKNRDTIVVLGGRKQSKESANEHREELPNILYTGFISDEKIKALYENCKAYIYVSLEEGFGLTPMEALACGSPIIISDIEVFREVYGDTAHYVDKNNANVDIDKLLLEKVEEPYNLLKKYTWENTAKSFIDIMVNYKER